MRQKKDSDTGQTKDQSAALGAMMRLRELLDEVEARIDADESFYANETAEKIVCVARQLRADTRRWNAST